MSQNKKQNYHIISLIGKGAYGDVYKARRKYTGQLVAIKTIKKKGKQDKDLKSMRQEIQILKKLKHENIVLLLDSFETSSQLIIVTELGQGQLFNLIQDDQFIEQSEIRKIAQQLVRALHYIHSNRITHRDMKPQNILMTSEGLIKLCDFGFARHMSYKTEVLTSLKGTPLYMAPEVVQEQPYTHTADLWSLGVILYELSTGSPPFTAPNLIKLVEHISKDPIRYPDTISGDFKSFLKGLLNKDPQQRLGWPELLNHPFVRETENQKLARKKRTELYTNWVDENPIIKEEDHSTSTHLASKSINVIMDEKSKDLSPNRSTPCNDSTWNNYMSAINDEKSLNNLRSDPNFLEQTLTVLATNFNEVMRVKEKKNQLQCSVKVLTQILMKSKTPEPKKMDISKNLNIPNYLLVILKHLVKMEGGKPSVDLIADIVRLIGLLGKITFNRNIGIEMVYLRSFVPLLPLLAKVCISGIDLSHQTLTINLLRTVGIFANNASANHIRSFSFYRDIVEVRLLQEFMSIIKHYADHNNVLRILVQVFSAFMHPVYGDIECFPWKRDSSSSISEFIQCGTMLECVRQSIINCLLENEVNWVDVFGKMLSTEDESALLAKISIQRILLQSIRQSKQFAEFLLFQCLQTSSVNSKNIIKILFQTLCENVDPIVYATTAIIIGQLVKCSREKKKERLLESFVSQVLPFMLDKLGDLAKLAHQNSNNSLAIYGVMIAIQEIINLDSSSTSNMSVTATDKPNQAPFFTQIYNRLSKEDYCKILTDYLNNSQNNKLEEMRKLEGSNYGVHILGFYDSCIGLIHRLLHKLTRDNDSRLPQFIGLLSQAKLQSKICGMLINLSSKTDLSPKGLISLLMIIYSISVKQLSKQFANQGFLKALIGLMKDQQIESLIEWPQSFGGGQTCVQILFGNLMKIFLLYLQEAEKENQITRIMYAENLVGSVVSFEKHLTIESISSIITFFVHLLSFDKPERLFVRQFVDGGGMALFVRYDLLKIKDNQDSINSVLESINLLSQIAKSSKDFYENIDSIDAIQDVKILIKHPDKNIKSRVLNLLGNMCRHSSYFYVKLGQNPQILEECINLCSDNDKTIKKFACVVLGNAGFHDDRLYPKLSGAIQILVTLLKDSEEKTRSNSAAALGNLARNSNILDRQFMRFGANHQLVSMFLNDKSIGTKKVSVMAITNLLSLQQSGKALLDINIKDIFLKYIPPTYNGDQGLIKTVQKALQKLK